MAARKAPAKTKAPAKATTRAKAAPAASTAAKRIKPITERFTKSQILNQISEETELSRKDVSDVLDSLTDIIEGHIKKRSCGEFVMPGLFKIVTVKKPARKARKGINPFTVKKQHLLQNQLRSK